MSSLPVSVVSVVCLSATSQSSQARGELFNHCRIVNLRTLHPSHQFNPRSVSAPPSFTDSLSVENIFCCGYPLQRSLLFTFSILLSSSSTISPSFLSHSVPPRRPVCQRCDTWSFGCHPISSWPIPIPETPSSTSPSQLFTLTKASSITLPKELHPTPSPREESMSTELQE